MSLSGAEEGMTRGKEGATWGEGPWGQRAAAWGMD